MEFITNNNGIRFKVCCASCENRVVDMTDCKCKLAKAKPKPDKQCAALSVSRGVNGCGQRERSD